MNCGTDSEMGETGETERTDGRSGRPDQRRSGDNERRNNRGVTPRGDLRARVSQAVGTCSTRGEFRRYASVALAFGAVLALALVAATAPAAAFSHDLGTDDTAFQAGDGDSSWSDGGSTDGWSWFGETADQADTDESQSTGDWSWLGQADQEDSSQSGQDESTDWNWTGQTDWFGEDSTGEDGQSNGDAGQSDDGTDGSSQSWSDWFSTDSSSGSDGSGWFGGSDGDTQQPQADDQGINRTELEMAVHEGINEVRADNGLGPLSFDEGLREVARYHSEDMAENGYFSHTSPSGETMSDRYQRFDYECRTPINEYMYGTGAENIFMYGSSAIEEDELADMVVDGWMNSEGHRANILDENVRREGIGVAVSEDGSVYVTENFC